MAAQGNPKLYARQKAKHLTLILLASLLLSVYVQAEVLLDLFGNHSRALFE